MIDDQSWAIRHVVIETSNWWVGHKVLVAPRWIKGVQWSDRSLSVDLSRDSIKNAPAYDATVEWSESEDQLLDRHFGRDGYWARSAGAVREPMLER